MLYELIAAMVRKSKRLNVVQSRAQYANGDFANSEQSRSSRELLETHELEDNEDHLTERDDNLDNMTGMILTTKYQQSKLASTYLNHLAS
jgi:hypothetical protein